MTLSNNINIDEFSIIRGGLLDRLLRKIKITGDDKYSGFRKTLFLISIVWLPLLVLSAIEGTLFGDKVELTFLKEFQTHIKLLLALPLLVLSETLVDARVKLIMGQFFHSDLLDEKGKQLFINAKIEAERIRESFWAEIVIFLIIVAHLIFRKTMMELPTTTWFSENFNNPALISKAGIWFKLISLPVFQIALLSWLWRWIVWIRLLFKISKLDLHLQPSHTDRSGGLGFLGDPPLPFYSVTFVLSLVFAGYIAEQIVYFNEKLSDNYFDIGILTILCTLINVLPLAVFVIKMKKARTMGLHNYSSLLLKHNLQFERKWKNSNAPILGSPDISAVADFGAVYYSVEKMKYVPFDLKTMAASIAISLLPLLPVVTLQMPVYEILRKLSGIIF